jgi:hypothetical protein
VGFALISGHTEPSRSIVTAQPESVRLRPHQRALRERGERLTLEGTNNPLMSYITATIDPPNDPTMVRARSRSGFSYRRNTSRTSGVNHATRPGDATTACGLEAEGMYLFPEIPFEERDLACGGCLASLSRR